MPSFSRYIGVDYSGAETPNASLNGLRIYLAEDELPPVEVLPGPSPRKYWTRRGVAEWLADRLAEEMPSMVGIDHGFSFPLRYFEVITGLGCIKNLAAMAPWAHPFMTTFMESVV